MANNTNMTANFFYTLLLVILVWSEKPAICSWKQLKYISFGVCINQWVSYSDLTLECVKKSYFSLKSNVEDAIHICHLEAHLWECPENGNVSVAISLLYDPNKSHAPSKKEKGSFLPQNSPSHYTIDLVYCCFFTCLHEREMCRWHPSPLLSVHIWLGKWIMILIFFIVGDKS